MFILTASVCIAPDYMLENESLNKMLFSCFFNPKVQIWCNFAFFLSGFWYGFYFSGLGVLQGWNKTGQALVLARTQMKVHILVHSLSFLLQFPLFFQFPFSVASFLLIRTNIGLRQTVFLCYLNISHAV